MPCLPGRRARQRAGPQLGDGDRDERILALEGGRPLDRPPMPAFSLSSVTCMATMPISAKATIPIQARPRISRSSSAWSTTAGRAGEGAGAPAPARGRTHAAAVRRRAAARRGPGAAGRSAGGARARRRPGRSRHQRGWPAAAAGSRAVLRRACGPPAGGHWRRAGWPRPRRESGRSPGGGAARPRARGRSRRPAARGGQMQPRARATRKRLTRPSSSEWKEIAGEAAARREQLPGERQRLVELAELVVDGDPQRLEASAWPDDRRRTGRAPAPRP